MGWRDRVTDALGGVLATGLELATETLRKATPASDEPSHREGGSRAMAVDGGDRQPLPPEASGEDPKGLLFDPFALIDQLGYRDRPSGITYQTLRDMARRVPIYTAIVQTRINQVAAFGQRQREPREPGFGIVLRDEKATPTKQDLTRMRQLEDWLLQTGAKWSPGRDSFKDFLRKVTRDSLILDQACFEIVRNRKGQPAEFYAIDGGTIRMADVPPGGTAHGNDTVRFVQVYDEVIIGEFGEWDLCFGVRNPRTDIRANGYGFSELEMLVQVVTAALWAFEYNKRFFSQGTAARGILNFKGSIPDPKIDAFRRQWVSMIAGVGNAHRTPMTNVDEIQWVDLGSTNRDMEFSAWMDWLIKVTCAVCQFDPAEINFTYGNSGQSGQMFGSPVESKLRASKDRGLRPLLTDLADWINVHLIWPHDPYFEFVFQGLDARSVDQDVDLNKKKSEYLMTVDELRAEEDLEPLPEGKGAVILNPTWLQGAQATDAAKQQQQQMAQQGGMPGQDGGPPPTSGEGDLGDLMAQQQGQDQGGGPEGPGGGEYEKVFEQSLTGPERVRALQRAREDTRLEKSDGKIARVRVYEIDL